MSSGKSWNYMLWKFAGGGSMERSGNVIHNWKTKVL